MTSQCTRTIRSSSPADTLVIGRAIGEALRSGDVLAITGPLGAGKTHLVKGIAAGLAV
jgi:tRNA threonylcarbamoyladenosine biosynthesis protein TsaE